MMKLLSLTVLLTALANSSFAQYTVNGNVRPACWGGTGTANVIFDVTISPQPESENGLSHVDVTFNKPMTITTQWNGGDSTTNGNTWSWNMLNDQPVVGAIFRFSNVDCKNGQLSEPITFSIKQSASPSSAGPSSASPSSAGPSSASPSSAGPSSAGPSSAGPSSASPSSAGPSSAGASAVSPSMAPCPV